MSEERLDAEKTAESSSNKRIKETSIDRLSALPDSLLIRILSFLETKEAAITSVLSKRWQFLWTELPRLEFRESSRDSEKIRKFVFWVYRALVICGGYGLEGFVVDFRYDKSFASDVNVWVEFAVKNKLKELTLLLDSIEDYHKLPQMLYSIPSLTSLSLRGCIMAPRRTLAWQSLTKLFLEEVSLRQHVIEKILSGCPALHSLHLINCWGFNSLKVNSQNLYELEIEECEEGGKPLLVISAPYIRHFSILLLPGGRKLRVTSFPYLVRAKIDVNGPRWNSSSEQLISNMEQLFENIRHVKELELGCECIKVLSMLVMNGWQLPQSSRGCLKLYAYREEQTTFGIVGLLESSSNLETLFIEGYDLGEDPVSLGLAAGCDLDCDLMHLKYVDIIDFADPNLADETILKLAQILLKRAVVLEKMEIEVEDITPLSTLAPSDIIKIARTLLSYPRSSQKAVILLR